MNLTTNVLQEKIRKTLKEMGYSEEYIKLVATLSINNKIIIGYPNVPLKVQASKSVE